MQLNLEMLEEEFLQEIMLNKHYHYQPSLGRAYLLIANIYADSANGCGDTQFNKRAVFWLAAQTAQKSWKS